MEKLEELIKEMKEAESNCTAGNMTYSEYEKAYDVFIDKEVAVYIRLQELTGIPFEKVRKLGRKNLSTVIEMMKAYAERKKEGGLNE